MKVQTNKLSYPDPITDERSLITKTGELVQIKRGFLNNYVIWKDEEGYLHEDKMSDVRIISKVDGSDLDDLEEVED